jgi:hypothetical protein
MSLSRRKDKKAAAAAKEHQRKVEELCEMFPMLDKVTPQRMQQRRRAPRARAPARLAPPPPYLSASPVQWAPALAIFSCARSLMPACTMMR